MPFEVVKKFEEKIAEWSGSAYGVAVESGTAAIFLSILYCKTRNGGKLAPITIPKFTYPSVPCSIINAGGKVKFEKKNWKGRYTLNPYPIVDSALRFKKGMYIPKSLYCLSFHSKKHLPVGRGGMILTDDKLAYHWLRIARFDGRNETQLEKDNIQIVGWNAYMQPEQAARESKESYVLKISSS